MPLHAWIPSASVLIQDCIAISCTKSTRERPRLRIALSAPFTHFWTSSSVRSGERGKPSGHGNSSSIFPPCYFLKRLLKPASAGESSGRRSVRQANPKAHPPHRTATPRKKKKNHPP